MKNSTIEEIFGIVPEESNAMKNSTIEEILGIVPEESNAMKNSTIEEILGIVPEESNALTDQRHADEELLEDAFERFTHVEMSGAEAYRLYARKLTHETDPSKIAAAARETRAITFLKGWFAERDREMK